MKEVAVRPAFPLLSNVDFMDRLHTKITVKSGASQPDRGYLCATLSEALYYQIECSSFSP